MTNKSLADMLQEELERCRELLFNPDNHEYKWNGKVVPSVTQILDNIRQISL
jgi:hypothetical protein